MNNLCNDTRGVAIESPELERQPKVAVVIPCFRVTRHILGVLDRIGPECSSIYVIDDCCPEGSGKLVEKECRDPRVLVLYHKENQGVGGAVMTGYRRAIGDGAVVIVKIDGDGQMAPELLPVFVAPILSGQADYAKGNRFYDLENISRMPRMRIIGNVLLSFLSKLSSGYWDLFDPTNGYTAIHSKVAAHLPFEKISKGYFFETDILFRLNIIRAVVRDVPMDPEYGDGISNLRVSRIVAEFLWKHLKNFSKRIFYNYYLRDLSIASLQLLVGIVFVTFGVIFGSYHWFTYARAGLFTPVGTIMLAALPIILGIQFILAFFSYDISMTPRYSIHASLSFLNNDLKRKAAKS